MSTICIIATIVKVGVGVIGAFVQSNEREQVTTHNKSENKNEYEEQTGDSLDFHDVKNLDIESSIYKVQVKSDNSLDCVRIQKYAVHSNGISSDPQYTPLQYRQGQSGYQDFLRKDTLLQRARLLFMYLRIKN